MTVPDLSIVIPAFNEERRLPPSLQAIAGWSRTSGLDVEVVVAENGSLDGTAEVARAWAAEHPEVRVLAGLPKGKGVAVREGMLAARGRQRFLCDADLSMPIDMLATFMPHVADGRTIAVGSREASGARRVGEPAYRHLMGRVFNLAVKLLVLPGVQDTQAGFKMFPADAAEAVFRRARLDGWAFDPEVLYIARRLGYRIVEVPIEWRYDTDSRVTAVSDSVAMFTDLVRIRWNALRGRYDGPVTDPSRPGPAVDGRSDGAAP